MRYDEVEAGSTAFTVYIVQCSDNTYYTGCTNDLEKRLKEHNFSKKGARYTKLRRPVELVYTEQFTTLLEARGREAEIKRWKRGKKERLWCSKAPIKKPLTKIITSI